MKGRWRRKKRSFFRRGGRKKPTVLWKGEADRCQDRQKGGGIDCLRVRKSMYSGESPEKGTALIIVFRRRDRRVRDFRRKGGGGDTPPRGGTAKSVRGAREGHLARNYHRGYANNKTYCWWGSKLDWNAMRRKTHQHGKRGGGKGEEKKGQKLVQGGGKRPGIASGEESRRTKGSF